MVVSAGVKVKDPVLSKSFSDLLDTSVELGVKEEDKIQRAQCEKSRV